jgi:acyl carrier protein
MTIQSDMRDVSEEATPSIPPDAAIVAPPPPGIPDASAIRAWLLDYLAQLLQMPAEEISSKDPLAVYGLDSSGAVGLAGDLNLWLGLKLDPDVVYYHPTVDALAAYLTSEGTRP